MRGVNSRDFEQLTAGDPRAFADLYDRYARLIRSICFDSLRDLTHAEDLTQEIFLRAYERIGQVKRPDRLGAWLTAITRRACLDWHRQRARDKHRYFAHPPDVEASTSTDEHPNDVDALRLAICELPEKERLAMHMYYLCEQPAEVAREILGMSASGFYKLVDRARHRLAGLMKTRGACHE